MKHNINPGVIIALGFLSAIIVGTLLLLLPFSAKSGVEVSFIDALFTATSAVCVTGLLTLTITTTWSLFGQFVIMVLIEVGGLGIITFTTIFMIALGKKIGLKDRILIQNAYNLDSTKGVVSLAQRVFKGTLIVEGVGALLYMFRFIPQYGIKGVWVSIFTSISAFCNAGMDLAGSKSLMGYSGDILVNIVTMALIILGGLGFPVWWYFIDTIKQAQKDGLPLSVVKKKRPLTVKIVIFTTIVLILGGALVTFIVEYNNPLTIGRMPLYQKIMASLFQSVTWRTAGFATISQANLRNATVIFGSVMMFIGGSPSGTAGGIKTTTIVVLLAAVISMLSDKEGVNVFHRSIKPNMVRRALSIFLVSLITMIMSLFLMCLFCEGNFVDIYYEVTSALGTVGLSRDYTGFLNTAGKIIIILSMYLGRIGPISLSMFFNSGKVKNKIRYIEEKVSIG